MGKLDKAVDFYLRGFNSQYIKHRTGISMQSLLKQQLSKGVKYTKDDVFNYQINYISLHFKEDAIKQAYVDIITNYVDPSTAKRGRNVTCLGCGFGDYVRVFKSLLGEDVYKKLRNDCWYAKQSNSIKQLYGVDNIFRKEVFSQFVSNEAIAIGRIKRTKTLLETYGVEHPNQHPDIVQKMINTCMETNIAKYGVPYPTQRQDVAMEVSRNRQKTMLKKYGFKNSVEIPEIRDKIFESRRKNGTLNSSAAEIELGFLLRERFGEGDVFYNMIIDDRYPYHVDYYIKSLDLFIELNGDKCHGDHWFDANDEKDLQIINSWSENMLRLEAESKKPSRYRKYIKTWTQTDVAKRFIAAQNNLNYLVFWDGSCRNKNKKQIPNLRDARLWFDAECPMPKSWNKVNTY